MKQTKRIYVAPAMQVVELKARHTLLVGSDPTPTRGIQKMDEEYLFNEDES